MEIIQGHIQVELQLAVAITCWWLSSHWTLAGQIDMTILEVLDMLLLWVHYIRNVPSHWLHVPSWWILRTILRLDRRPVPAGACTHACTCEAQGDAMEACVHRMLYSRLYNLVWTSFAIRTLAELGSTYGIGLLYSVSAPRGMER
jgi:hypothetical protein